MEIALKNECTEIFLSENFQTLVGKNQQKTLNKIFTTTRRNKMLKNAETDALGRAVKYYRFMPKEGLYSLIQKGRVDSSDHYDTPDFFSEENIQLFLLSYINFLTKNCPASPMLSSVQDMCTLIKDLGGGSLSPEIFLSKNHAGIANMVRNQMDYHFLARGKSGSLFQKFMPFISLGAGGPAGPSRIASYYHNGGGCHVEFIIPQKHILPGLYSFKCEKEVFTQELRSEWISRAYVDPDFFIKEIIANPEEPIGIIYADMLQNPDNYQSQGRKEDLALQHWRFNTSTDDYLPKGFLAGYTKKETEHRISGVIDTDTIK